MNRSTNTRFGEQLNSPSASAACAASRLSSRRYSPLGLTATALPPSDLSMVGRTAFQHASVASSNPSSSMEESDSLGAGDAVRSSSTCASAVGPRAPALGAQAAAAFSRATSARSWPFSCAGCETKAANFRRVRRTGM